MQRISLSRAQAEWEGLVATAQLAELFFFLIKFLAKHLQQVDDIYWNIFQDLLIRTQQKT